VHKRLLLLGLLRNGPLSGYELHRIVRAHGDLYADLKKANIYYLLERLEQESKVSKTVEGGARGRRGERLIYKLTAAGRREFDRLLRRVLLDFELAHSGVDVAVVFLASVSREEALALFEARRGLVAARRERVVGELEQVAKGTEFQRIASDHIVSTIDAELDWIDRSLTSLRAGSATELLPAAGSSS
jgi:DNA-binding PadR family transcriptional regulator